MKGSNTMKKKTAISIFAACALLMSGCAQNGGSAASTTTTAVTTTAAETTKTAAETTTAAVTYPKADISTQTRLFRGYVETDKAAEYLFGAPDEGSEQLSELTYGMILEIYTCEYDGWYVAELGGEKVGYVKADIIKEYPHTYPFGDPLFGGYVASESAIKLYSEADESSDVIREIESGTQIEIYECEAEGWYMTAIAKADGTTEYDVGYVKAEYIAEIPAYDMDEYTPSLSDIAGEWIYEEQDMGITDKYVGRPVGRYSIFGDGKFTYTSNDESTSSGTIGIIYEEYENGSKVPLFVFYNESGESFMACQATAPAERTEGCLYIGNAGESRLVPAEPAPNEYGFYPFPDPPASSISVASLSGTWYSNDSVLTIKEGSDLYNGTFLFTDANGTSEGYIKLEYLLEPDDTKSFWYTFYKNDGTLWNAFGANGEIPLNDLYAGQSGEPHFARKAEAYITDIVGVWNEADVLDSRTLTVNEDGTFKLEYRGGGTLFGTVKIEYEDHPDGSQTAWFSFYEEDGKMWEGFQRSDTQIMNDLYAGNSGEPHFVRAS